MVSFVERFLFRVNRNEEIAPDIRYAAYVAIHKLFVYQAGRMLGVPRLQLLLHDLHKLTPSEWTPYVNSFYRKKSPRRKDGGYDPNKVSAEFDYAWLHHQKTMGKHHWQFWLLPLDDGGFKALEMPEKYVIEMVADWMGAGKAINGRWDVGDWYRANRDKMILHPKTRNQVNALLGVT